VWLIVNISSWVWAVFTTTDHRNIFEFLCWSNYLTTIYAVV